MEIYRGKVPQFLEMNLDFSCGILCTIQDDRVDVVVAELPKNWPTQHPVPSVTREGWQIVVQGGKEIFYRVAMKVLLC